MRRALRIGGLGTLAVSLLIAAYLFGVHRGRVINNELVQEVLVSVQADLALNHLETYSEIESDLARSCISQAQEKLRYNADLQSYVLSGMLKDKPGTVDELIKRRDPRLLEQLTNYKRSYGNGWMVPKCKS